MRVAAGMMVKDEADVIEQTIVRLGQQGVDHVYVMDNGSTDGTRDLVADLVATTDWISLRDDTEPGYYQSNKMTRLLKRAARDGYQWFVPCDADELWGVDWPYDRTVYEVLATTPDQVAAVTAVLYDHFATGRDDLLEPDPFKRLVWRTPNPTSLPKVAVRCDPRIVIEMGNHGAYALEQGVRTDLITAPGLRIDHFPYRSPEQFIRKARNGAAAYAAATGLPESAGVHWKMYGQILQEHGEAGLRQHWREHFFYPDPERHLLRDPVYA